MHVTRNSNFKQSMLLGLAGRLIRDITVTIKCCFGATVFIQTVWQNIYKNIANVVVHTI